MTTSLLELQDLETERGYLRRLGASSWAQLHDDARADFRAGRAAARQGRLLGHAVAEFEVQIDDPEPLRQEDFVAGYRSVSPTLGQDATRC